MIGAIAGDVIGSVYEARPIKTVEFELFDPECGFTDDTVLTIAVADFILHGGDLAEKFKTYYHLFPDRGYGGGFRQWACSSSLLPYASFGNGAAMRVSPVGFASDSLGEAMQKAKETAEVTHNHLEGIRSAQAVASCIYLAREGKSKDQIREFIESTIGYDLSESIDSLRLNYEFDATAIGSVPEALRAFYEAESYEEAIRLAVSLGGDSDTQACIAGGIAQAYFKSIPEVIIDNTLAALDDPLIEVIIEFNMKFGL